MGSARQWGQIFTIDIWLLDKLGQLSRVKTVIKESFYGSEGLH